MAGCDNDRARIWRLAPRGDCGNPLGVPRHTGEATQSLHHTGVRPTYSRMEVLEVFIELHRVFGLWLISGEYFQFVELRRRAALALGQPEPRLPSQKPLNRLFGGYAGTLARRGPSPTNVEPRRRATMTRSEAARERVHPVTESWWRVISGTSETNRRFLHHALVRRLRASRGTRGDLMLSALERCKTTSSDIRPIASTSFGGQPSPFLRNGQRPPRSAQPMVLGRAHSETSE